MINVSHSWLYLQFRVPHNCQKHKKHMQYSMAPHSFWSDRKGRCGDTAYFTRVYLVDGVCIDDDRPKSSPFGISCMWKHVWQAVCLQTTNCHASFSPCHSACWESTRRRGGGSGYHMELTPASSLSLFLEDQLTTSSWREAGRVCSTSVTVKGWTSSQLWSVPLSRSCHFKWKSPFWVVFISNDHHVERVEFAALALSLWDSIDWICTSLHFLHTIYS